MAPTRRYDGSPNLASLYARTVKATLRPGSPDESEPVTLELPRLRVDAGHLASYREVTGFDAASVLPVTYPHVLAFPLHLDLMSDPSFPHRPMGIVHLANTITQHRPIPVGAELAISVFAEPERPHPKGTVFDLVSEVRVGDEPAWVDRTTLLSRGPGSPDAEVELLPDPSVEPTAEWDLMANLGRRYAAVSGDRNPIHLFKLSAQAFGFPRQIAHGMWAKAASLASIDSLPEALTVRVDFRKPLPLPSRASFGYRTGDRIDFALYGDDRVHLIGRVDPIS
jgi:MaoC like domain